jgi:hypothetical protein
MACPGGCNKKEAPVDSPVFSYTTSSDIVTAWDGRRYALNGPVNDVRPRGGYRAKFPVKGHVQQVSGRTPQEAFASAVALFRANGIEVDAEVTRNLWLNLNIQWAERVGNEGKLKVRTADLMQIAGTVGEAPKAAAVKDQNWPPRQWGSKGWANLQMYLAGNVYEYNGFLRRAIDLGDLVNPDLNPSIGCADCYRHFAMALAVLKQRPLHTQNEARQWLFKLMNEVNARRVKEGDSRARTLTYEQAAVANHWR